MPQVRVVQKAKLLMTETTHFLRGSGLSNLLGDTRPTGLCQNIAITSSSKSNKSVYCKLCCCELSVAHGGIHDIKRHVESLKHKAKLKQTEGSSLTSFLGEASPPSLSHSKRVISAEIMAQFIAMHNLSFQSSDHLSDLFSSMFPDSKIAASFACKHTKTKAIICDAIDPHLKQPVIELAKSSPFSLLCDESNEKGNQVKLLTILIRIFDPCNSIVVTRHFGYSWNS